MQYVSHDSCHETGGMVVKSDTLLLEKPELWGEVRVKLGRRDREIS